MHINLNQFYKPFIAWMNDMVEEYGEEFQRLNGLHNENLNFTGFIDHFIDNSTVADSTIDSNANNSTKDVRTLMSDMMKPHTKLLALHKIFYEISKKYGLQTARDWATAEWNGGLYLHDAPTASYLPYCFAYDLEDLVNSGLFFIDKFKTKAPQHLTTYNDHVLNFISWTSNRTSGACGLPSYLVYSYYFWKHDVENEFYLKDPEYYRRQCFQNFIYDLNQPYLRVVECAFINITIMDRPYLTELFGMREFPDGTMIIEYIDEIIEHQKVFMEVVSEIRKEQMFTFPVLTFSLLYQNGKFVDEEFARWCNKHNMQWADSNFYVGSDVTSLSSCCRLINDFSKLDGFINSIGGTSLKIGSVKVNTINLRRIALESNFNKDKYFEILKERLDLCIKALDRVRHIIKRNIDKGLLPNYTYGLIELKRQYNTIGINGMYETIRDFGGIEKDEFGNEFYSEDGLEFAIQIMDYINEIKDSYDFDYSINVEAVPAERCAVVLCQKDKLLYNVSDNDFIYSNQWIPLTSKCTLQEKVRLGSILDKKVGGGQIAHINLDAPLTNEEQAWKLLNYIAKSGVIYFAYNLRISVCENQHAFYGDICPVCGGPKTDEYTRIVGYLVPTSSYSAERKKEESQRYWYDLSDSIK